MRSTASLSLLALAALLLGVAPAHATDAELSQQAHRIARDVMSPFCPGRTLADCPSPDALVVREEIRAKLSAGVDEATVRAELFQRFGDAVVGVPRGALGWALPILLLLAGVAVLVQVLRRLSAPAPQPPAMPADLEAELDRDLKSRGLS